MEEWLNLLHLVSFLSSYFSTLLSPGHQTSEREFTSCLEVNIQPSSIQNLSMHVFPTILHQRWLSPSSILLVDLKPSAQYPIIPKARSNSGTNMISKSLFRSSSISSSLFLVPGHLTNVPSFTSWQKYLSKILEKDQKVCGAANQWRLNTCQNEKANSVFRQMF